VDDPLDDLCGDLPVSHGLFGPDRPIWHVTRSPLLVVGSTMALVYQLAYPVVAQGVEDHSNLRKDPVGRGRRTLGALATLILGSREEVRTALAGVRAAHRVVKGTITAATDATRAGEPYDARDVEARKWVFACFVHAIVDAHRVAVLPLTPTTLDLLWEDFAKLGRAFGLAPDPTWTDWAAFDGWFQRALDGVSPGPGTGASGRLVLGTTARELSTFLFNSWVARWKVDEVIAHQLFHPKFRPLIGLRRTPRVERCGAGLMATLRTAAATLPRTIVWSPGYRAAMERVERDWASAPRDPNVATARGPGLARAS
jgi:uncharacterized protein (DUF2236 family)